MTEPSMTLPITLYLRIVRLIVPHVKVPTVHLVPFGVLGPLHAQGSHGYSWIYPIQRRYETLRYLLRCFSSLILSPTKY